MMNEIEKQELISEFMEEVKDIAAELSDGTLPEEDLLQEGYVGLMRGLAQLEKERENEEAAYGGLSVTETMRSFIRGAMEEAVEEQKRLLRQDDRLVVQVELLSRSIERLTQELGTKPNIDEIANDMKLSQDTVLKILKLTGEVSRDEDFIPPAVEQGVSVYDETKRGEGASEGQAAHEPSGLS